MKEKQVVISKSWGALLPPYWFVKYLEKKNIKCFCYKENFDKNNDTQNFKLISTDELSNFNDFNRYLSDIEFLTEYNGNIISISDFNKLDDNVFIDYYDLIENREDKDLIEIAKLINNEKYVKIVNIPSEVKYDIYDNECSAGEFICEQHRTWS